MIATRFPYLRWAAGHLLPPVALFAFVVLCWHFAVCAFEIPPFLVPPPSAVVQATQDKANELAKAFLVTGFAACAGFLASLLFGTLIAFVFSQSVLVRRAAYPYAIFLQTVPIVAIAPLIIMWVGYGLTSIVIISFVISLFPIITNTTTGLTTLDRSMVELFEVNNATRLQRLMKLQLPNAVPYAVAGARISAGLSVIGTIVGEFFSGIGGNRFGLGYLVYYTNSQLKTAELFSAVFASTLLGLALFAVVSGAGALLTRRWREPDQH
jgi:NitT/TauT family transport system permease protein